MRSRTLQVSLVLLFVIALVGCEGDQGPAGPAGPQGLPGSDGNATVIMYEFGSQSTSTGNLGYNFPASAGLIDSSLVLAYFKDGAGPQDLWYPVPGLGPNNDYMVRSFIDQVGLEHRYQVRLRTPDGSADYTNSVTFSEFRIILAPASEIIQLTTLQLLDLSDYRAVRKHFDLLD
jgi:hypothetical protein